MLQTHASRPIQATIAPSAFRHNYLLMRARAAGARAFAVVKANAYGHGLLPCARAVADVADGYALLELAEALSLREAGIDQPVLLLEGAFGVADLLLAARHRLALVVHCEEQLRMIELTTLDAPLSVFLKANTGMNRLGFTTAAWPDALARLRATGKADTIVAMTHFATADGAGISAQKAEFDAMFALARARALTSGVMRSLANSAALLRYPESHTDWVRPGIVLYGGSPMPSLSSAEEIGLRPVMSLHARIIGVQELRIGDRVGYGASFVADRPMRIGVVSCGYADGYPRHAPTGTPIAVDGRRTRTLGRVSMDMLACDLTELPGAGIGSVVELWGARVPADEVAEAAGTISYELFCALASRVPVREVDA